MKWGVSCLQLTDALHIRAWKFGHYMVFTSGTEQGRLRGHVVSVKNYQGHLLQKASMQRQHEINRLLTESPEANGQ